MTPKKLVQDFYKSEALINATVMDGFLHPEFVLEWHSSTGFLKLNREEFLARTKSIEVSYVRSKAKISQIISVKEMVSVSFSYHVKTMENPREEMLLAHVMVMWEVKDNMLYRGYQMSKFG